MTDLALHRGRPLRVLHGVYEIAGQGLVLARALRELGCDTRSFAYETAWDGRVSDVVVDLAGKGPLARGALMLASFLRWGPWADVHHLHFGTSFLPRQLDMPVLARLGKRIVFHFHGCEIRDRAHMLATHRLATCTECDPFCRPAHQRWLRARAARYADAAVFSTLDLAESVPGGVQLPLAIEADVWEGAARAHPLPDAASRDGVHGPVVVAHAPTNRLIKGTRYVIEAVERLRAELPRIELRMIERRPWAEMPAFLAGCDILVDQLMMGTYGLLAIEGMSEGKAVVAHLREDFRGAPPGLPVVDAEPATIAHVLRELIRDPFRRTRLGEQGVAFVRRHHHAPVVAQRLLQIYQECLARPAGARRRDTRPRAWPPRLSSFVPPPAAATDAAGTDVAEADPRPISEARRSAGRTHAGPPR